MGESRINMKILVTGANGYIGNHVVTSLLDRGHYVVACDIKTDNIDRRAQIVKFDIFQNCNKDDLFVKFGSPDVCMHLAWRDGFVHNSPCHMQDLSAHYIFLTNLINQGLRQLAVMGTMHEVGYFEGKIEETTPCFPLSLYSVAKNSLRQSLMLFCQQNNCLLQWLRGFYIFGDDLKNHSIFTKLVEAAQRGEKTFPFTSGKNKYDFISVEELVNQITAVLLQTEISGIINCCSGKPISLADAVESFIKNNNLKIKLNYGVYPDRVYDSPCIYGDDSKIQSILKINHG